MVKHKRKKGRYECKLREKLDRERSKLHDTELQLEAVKRAHDRCVSYRDDIIERQETAMSRMNGIIALLAERSGGQVPLLLSDIENNRNSLIIIKPIDDKTVLLKAAAQPQCDDNKEDGSFAANE